VPGIVGWCAPGAVDIPVVARVRLAPGADLGEGLVQPLLERLVGSRGRRWRPHLLKTPSDAGRPRFLAQQLGPRPR
jgi:hypothetical protein